MDNIAGASLPRRRVNLHLPIIKTGAGYRAGLSSPDSGRSRIRLPPPASQGEPDFLRLIAGAGDSIGSTRGFRLDRSAEGGVRNRWLDGLPFRREERLGRVALARDRLTVVTAEVVLLLPVIEQGSLRWSKPISS